MMGIKARLVLASMLGALALSTVGAPKAQAATTTCRVRNVTQDVTGHSFAAMVKSALDGDHFNVRGTCLARDVVIEADLAIRGVGDVRPVLDARGERRGLYIRRGATVTLRHLAITGKHSTVDVVGISNRGVLTLTDSVVRDHRGGGIGNAGTLTLVRSVIRGNTAYNGGGIYNGLEADLIIDRSVVRDNRAEAEGGGIATLGKVTLVDSIVRSNAAGIQGGGIISWDYGTVTLDATSSVTGNTPDDCFGTAAC